MKQSVVLDLTELPRNGLGTASLTWWGTLAFMLIEGTGFALIDRRLSLPHEPGTALAVECAATRSACPGTALTALLIASLLPNILIARWARRSRI
jgi:cytochrome c oxidase subunit 3